MKCKLRVNTCPRYRYNKRNVNKRKKPEEERTNLPSNILRFLKENIEKRV